MIALLPFALLFKAQLVLVAFLCNPGLLLVVTLDLLSLSLSLFFCFL
jgi:hypothetical protein